MNKPFAPFKPEKMIMAEISGREAHLLKTLRKYQFGKFMIQKLNGLVIRVEINESQVLKEDEGLDLAMNN